MTNLLLSHSAGFTHSQIPANQETLCLLLAPNYLKNLEKLDIKRGNSNANRFSPENIFKTILVNYDSDVCIVRMLCNGGFGLKKPNISTCQLLMKAKFPPHHGCHEAQSLLYCAVDSGRARLVEILLYQCQNKQQEVNYCSPTGGVSLLHQACIRDEHQIPQLLIKAGANLNKLCLGLFYDHRQETPLHQVASMGKIKPMKALIDAGADCNIEASTGETPLYLALYRKQYKCAKLLLPHTTNLNFSIQTMIQQQHHHLAGPTSLLHEACRAPDSYFLEQLLKTLSTEGIIALMADIGDSLIIRAVLDRRQVHIKTLLFEYGANPMARDENGNTALLLACRRTDIGMALILLEAGADVNQTSTKGDSTLTALHEVMRRPNCMELVRLLLDWGADVRAKNSPQGETPLHIAAMQSMSDLIFRELLIHGAKLTDLDNKNNTPFHSMAMGWSGTGITYTRRLQVARVLSQEDAGVVGFVNLDGNTALDMFKLPYDWFDEKTRERMKSAGWNAILAEVRI